MQFVVKNRSNNSYLTSSYYKKILPVTNNLYQAHVFNSFELLLASKTVLLNRKNYIVYDLENIKKQDCIDELEVILYE